MNRDENEDIRQQSSDASQDQGFNEKTGWKAAGDPQSDSESISEEAAKQAAQSSEEQPSGQGSEQAAATSPEELTIDEIKALQEKAAQAEANREQLLRQRADYENFKKRAARERQDAIKYANEGLLEQLLPIIDNFEMALKAAENQEATDLDNFRQGVSMIHTQLVNLLKENGLEPIDASNQPFDPKWHEALSEQETNEIPDGHVAQQIRKGYRLKDRLLRPCSVVVAKKPESTSSNESDSDEANAAGPSESAGGSQANR